MVHITEGCRRKIITGDETSQVVLYSCQRKREQYPLAPRHLGPAKKCQARDGSRHDRQREQQERLFTTLFEHGGLWVSETDMAKGLDGLSIQKATAAVKAQINIRQKVLVVTKDKVIMSQHLPGLKNTLLTW